MINRSHYFNLNLINDNRGSLEALMETVLRDMRFGLRMLLKNPGVTAVAIITMALGLGANTALFSVVNGVMLKSLPFKDPDRLVFALETNTKFPPPGISASTLNYQDWKEQSKSFESMSARQSFTGNITSSERPEKIKGENTTLAGETGMQMYQSSAQSPFLTGGLGRTMNFLLRTDVAPTTIADSARKAFAGLNPTLPVSNVKTMEDIIYDSVAPFRFNVFLLGLFAAIAMALTLVRCVRR